MITMFYWPIIADWYWCKFIMFTWYVIWLIGFRRITFQSLTKLLNAFFFSSFGFSFVCSVTSPNRTFNILMAIEIKWPENEFLLSISMIEFCMFRDVTTSNVMCCYLRVCMCMCVCACGRVCSSVCPMIMVIELTAPDNDFFLSFTASLISK